MLDTGTPDLTVMAILGGFKKRDATVVIRRILEQLQKQVPDRRELHKYLTQLKILSNIKNLNISLKKEISAMAFK
jgi:hypothetical protein